MYLRQALASIEDDAYDDALEYIRKAYDIDPNPHINHFYTLTLSTLGRYVEALNVANEQKKFYLEHEQNALLYTTLLIKNNLFIEAEHLIQKNNLHSYSLFNQEWETLEKELDLERELVSFEIDMKNKETKRKLMDISQYSMMDQIEIIQEARRLDLPDLQMAAAVIFSSPFLSGQVQRSYLEVLIEKQDGQTYSFPWFNQHKLICPKELATFRDTLIALKVESKIEDKLLKQPTLSEIVKVEIINDLLLLYPFIEEVVTDMDYWIDCYIEQLDYSDEPSSEVKVMDSTEEEAAMRQWLKHLTVHSQRSIN